MLLMSNVSIYQRFFAAAKLDLEAAKVLKDKGLYQPAIYHLQQAYEKCVKSYYILKEVKLKNTPETTAYDNACPLKEFSYYNLDLLDNQYDACQKIIEMLDDMFNLVSKDLK